MILKTFIIIAVVAFATLAVGIVVASYIMTSNNVTVDVTEPVPNATLALTTSNTNIVEGNSVTLTATVSDGASGIAIDFWEGSQYLGSDTTDSLGKATIQLFPAVGSHVYTAQGEHA